MRIAAYCAGYEPTAGGGYTFETEVLEALLKVGGGKSGIEFVLLCPEANAQALSTHVAGSGPRVQPVRTGFAERRLQPFLRESAIVRAHWRRPSAIDRAAAVAGADLVWFLGAGVHYTNLPYVTVVWDLQHRATPWFPELSANGVWDGRELAHDWFLKRASAVIVGTEVGRKEVEDFYAVPPNRIPLLPHPTPQFALDAGPGAPALQDIAHLKIKRAVFSISGAVLGAQEPRQSRSGARRARLAAQARCRPCLCRVGQGQSRTRLVRRRKSRRCGPAELSRLRVARRLDPPLSKCNRAGLCILVRPGKPSTA